MAFTLFNQVKNYRLKGLWLFLAVTLNIINPVQVYSQDLFDISSQDFSVNIKSSEFETLCTNNNKFSFQKCENIGKTAYISTKLIYDLFLAESANLEPQKAKVLEEITKFYQADKIEIINKRLKINDFFQLEEGKVFGGYAVMIRSQEIQPNGRKKVSYIIALKGVHNNLDDPNDIAAALIALPAYLYPNAGTLMHAGFRNYALSVFEDSKSQKILQEVLKEQKQPNTDVEVLVTGHSLGGCAILYAAKLKDAGVLTSNLKVIVFGSSPIAQAGFVEQYQDLIPKITRIETEGDMLIYENDSPMKPIYDSFGYVPFGQLIKAKPTDKLVILNQKKRELEVQIANSTTQELLPAYLALMKEIATERIAIHIYSYRYYYQYYQSLSKSNN